MGSSIAKTLIDKYGGQFLEKDYKISISLINSDISMQNVRIRPEALDFLGLPVKVKYGYLGSLNIDFSYRHLTTKPIIVHVKDVFLIAGPLPPNVDEKEPTEQEIKEAIEGKIKAKLESLQIWEEENFGEEAKATYGMADKIVDNLQILVRNVHVRFEGSGYSAGVAMKSLELYPTDEKGKRIEIITDKDPLTKHRGAVLDGLSMYLNTDEPMERSEQSRTETEQMLLDIYKEEHKLTWNFVIAPIRAQSTVIRGVPSEIQLSRREDQIPKLAASLEIALEMSLSHAQYNSILALAEDLQGTAGDSAEKLAAVRPPSRPPTLEEKIEYIKIYVRKFKTKSKDTLKPPEKAETERLKELEYDFSGIEVLQLRRYAVEAALKLLDAKEQKELQIQGAQGMLGGFFSRKGLPSLPEDEWKALASGETSKQKELAEAEAKAKELKALPKAYTRTAAKLVMSRFKFTLKAPPIEHAPIQDIVEYEVKALSVNVAQRSDSTRLELKVASVKAIDHYTKDSVHKEFFRPAEEKGDKLVDVAIEMNPPNSNLDTDIQAKLKGVDITYVPSLISRIIWFVTPTKPVNLDEIQKAAAQIAQERYEQAQAQFAEAIKNRTRVQMDINVKAPNLIVPGEPQNPKGDLLILDLGALRFRSILAENPLHITEDSDALLERANSTDVLTEEFLMKLFDRFKVEISQVMLFVASTDAHWKENKADARTVILNPLDLPLDFSSAISPLIKTLPSTVLNLNLGQLKVVISPDRLKRVMKIVTFITNDAKDKAQQIAGSQQAIGEQAEKEDLKDDKEKENAEKKAAEANEVQEKEEKAEEIMDEDAYKNTSIDLSLILQGFTLEIVDDTINLGETQVSKERGIMSATVGLVRVHFKQRTNDMSAELSISYIQVLDLYQSYGEEFKYMISTGEQARPLLALADTRENELVKQAQNEEMSLLEVKANDRDEKKGEEQFFKISFKDISPEAKDIFKNVRKDLSLDVGTLVVSLNKYSLPVFAQFFMYRLMPPSPPSESGDQFQPPEPTPEEKAEAERVKKERREKLKGYLKGDGKGVGEINLRVKADFEALQVLACVKGRVCARARMSGFTSFFEDAEAAQEVELGLHGIWLADLSGGKQAKHPYAIATKKLHADSDSDLVSAGVILAKPAEERPEGYLTPEQPAGIRAKASISGIRVCVLMSFLMGLADFPNPLLEELAKPPPADTVAEAIAAGGHTPATGGLSTKRRGKKKRIQARRRRAKEEEKEKKKKDEVKKEDLYSFTHLQVELSDVSIKVPQNSKTTSALCFELAKFSLGSCLRHSSELKLRENMKPAGTLVEEISVKLYDPDTKVGEPGARIYSDLGEEKTRLPFLLLPEIQVALLRLVPQSKTGKGWGMFVDAEIDPIPLIASNPQIQFLTSLSSGNLSESPVFGDEEERKKQSSSIQNTKGTRNGPKEEGGGLATVKEEHEGPNAVVEGQKQEESQESFFRVKFKEMSVLLLRDPYKEKSPSMAIRWEIHCDARTLPSGDLTVSASLVDVYIFNHEIERKKPLKEQIESLGTDDIVLGPTRMDVSVLQTKSSLLPDSPLLRVRVKGQYTKMRVGYKDYALVLACAGSLGNPQEEERDDEKSAGERKEVGKAALNVSDYDMQPVTWEKIRGGISQLELLNADAGIDSKEEDEDAEAAAAAAAVKGEQNIKVTLEGAMLELVNDVLGVALPVARIKFQALDLKMNQFGNQNTLSLMSGAEAWYYNQTVCHWEPMLEPWSLSAYGNLVNGEFAAYSRQPLLLNVSRGMLDSVYASLELMDAAQEAAGGDAELKRTTKTFSAYEIVNETLFAVRFVISDTKNSDSKTKRTNIGERKGLVQSGSKAALGLLIEQPEPVILSVKGFEDLSVDLKQVHSQQFRVRKGQSIALDKVKQPPLIAAVVIKHGIRQIVIRPSLALRNMTGAVLLLGSSDSDEGKTKRLPPGESCWLSSVPGLSAVTFRVAQMSAEQQPKTKVIVGGPENSGDSGLIHAVDPDESKKSHFDWGNMLHMKQKKDSGTDDVLDKPELRTSNATDKAGCVNVIVRTVRENAHQWTVIITPPFSVSNYLPCACKFKIASTAAAGDAKLSATPPAVVEIKPAGVFHFLGADPTAITVQTMLPWQKQWSEPVCIKGSSRIEHFSTTPGTKDALKLEMEIGENLGQYTAAVYAPVWVYNACIEPALNLEVASGNSVHPLSTFATDEKFPVEAEDDGKHKNTKEKDKEASPVFEKPCFLVGPDIKNLKVRIQPTEEKKDRQRGPGEWSKDYAKISVSGTSGMLQVLAPAPSKDSAESLAAARLRQNSRTCGMGCGGCRASRDPIKRSAFSIGWSTELAPAPFSRTLVLTLAPHIFIRNELPAPVLVRQALTGLWSKMKSNSNEEGDATKEVIKKIESGAQIAYHWSHAFLDQLVCFKIKAQAPCEPGGALVRADRDWEWSGPVCIDHPGDFGFLLRCHELHYQVRIEVRSRGSSLFAVLRPENTLTPPVRVINACALDLIRFSQRGGGLWTDVPPYHETGYSWDYPCEDKALTLHICEDSSEASGKITRVHVDIAEEIPLRTVKVVHGFEKKTLYLTMIQDGPTHLISLSDVPLPGSKSSDSGALLRAVGLGLKLPTAHDEVEILQERTRRIERNIKDLHERLKKARKAAAEFKDAHFEGDAVEVQIMDLKDVAGAVDMERLRVQVALCNRRSGHKITKSVPLLAISRGEGVLLPARGAIGGRDVQVAVFRKNKIFSDTYLGGCSRSLDDLAFDIMESQKDGKEAHKCIYSERWLPLDRRSTKVESDLPPSDGEVLVRIAYYPSVEKRIEAVTHSHRIAFERASRISLALRPQLENASLRAEREYPGRSSSTRGCCSCMSREVVSPGPKSVSDAMWESRRAELFGYDEAEERVRVWVVKNRLERVLKKLKEEEEKAAVDSESGERLLLRLSLGNQERIISVEDLSCEWRDPVTFDMPSPLQPYTRVGVKVVIADDCEGKESKCEVLGETEFTMDNVEICEVDSVASRSADFERKLKEVTGISTEDDTEEKARTWSKKVVEFEGKVGDLILGVDRRPLELKKERPTSRYTVGIPEVGLSLIREGPLESFYWSMNVIIASMASSPTTDSTELSVGHMQFDRQIANIDFPVILAPKAIAPEKRQPFIQIGVATARTRPGVPVSIYRYFSVLLQEMDLKVEEELINMISEYVADLTEEATSNTDPAAAVWGSGAQDKKEICLAYFTDMRELNSPPAAGTSKTFFRLLQLQPLALNLSFKLSGKASGGHGKGKLGVPNPFKILGHMAGATFGNLNGAPIRLNALTVENAYGDQATLLAPILAHYKKQGLGQAYKLVGSIEVLGDPVALVGNLGEGVADFFYEPAQGLVSSPQAFGIGLARGTASLLKHTVSGLFGAASKVTGSVGRGVATLSMDPQFIKERQDDLKDPPEHVGEGVYRGGKRLCLGLFHGVTGLALDPYYGARQGGVSGFFRGCGVGLAGIFVKPAVGLVDFGSLTLQGIGNTATYFDTKYENSPRRPQRYISGDHVLRIYNRPLSSLSQSLVTLEPPHREQYDREVMLGAVKANPYAHIVASNERVVVVINKKNAKEQAKNSQAQSHLVKKELETFQFSWDDLSAIKAVGCLLVFKTGKGPKEVRGKNTFHVVCQAQGGMQDDYLVEQIVAVLLAVKKEMKKITTQYKELEEEGIVILDDDYILRQLPPVKEFINDNVLLALDNIGESSQLEIGGDSVRASNVTC